MSTYLNDIFNDIEDLKCNIVNLRNRRDKYIEELNELDPKCPKAYVYKDSLGLISSRIDYLSKLLVDKVNSVKEHYSDNSKEFISSFLSGLGDSFC